MHLAFAEQEWFTDALRICRICRFVAPQFMIALGNVSELEVDGEPVGECHRPDARTDGRTTRVHNSQLTLGEYGTLLPVGAYV